MTYKQTANLGLYTWYIIMRFSQSVFTDRKVKLILIVKFQCYQIFLYLAVHSVQELDKNCKFYTADLISTLIGPLTQLNCTKWYVQCMYSEGSCDELLGSSLNRFQPLEIFQLYFSLHISFTNSTIVTSQTFPVSYHLSTKIIQYQLKNLFLSRLGKERNTSVWVGSCNQDTIAQKSGAHFLGFCRKCVLEMLGKTFQKRGMSFCWK